jgi:hypothetical protein
MSAGERMRSSLGFAAETSRDPDPNGARRRAKHGWVQQGFVAIDPNWLPPAERAALIAIAEKVHGKRAGK